MRIGLMDPAIAARPAADALTRANHLAASVAGLDSFWLPDHLNSLFPRALWRAEYTAAARIVPSPDAYLEPWTLLGHIAARNRMARLRLGVGVTDAGRRNPAVTAQAAATLHLLSRGRAILGIGCGEREGNEPYGVDWSRPVARFEEAVATIRALWDSNGELVNRDSPFFPLRDAVFDLPPYKGTRPEVWIAAHGPRMLRAAGRYADGFFPAFPHTPQEYARRLDVVRGAASDAGRDPMSIVPAMWVMTVVGRSRADVDEALQSETIRAEGLLSSDEYFALHGGAHPLGAGFSGAQDLLPHAWDEKTALSYVGKVPIDVVRNSLLCGTPDEIVDQAAVWRDCGVRYLVLSDITMLQRRLLKGFAGVPMGLKAVRGLKRL
ncbi:LLM class flavin-dependent oxidoreductase [Mycolicibacterium litorale]|uniref:LLM class flavin-dependent oxidoreductase n=1 Tax=Mycolicibacterium litorale TaxID=758802 RepID=UPI003CE8DDCD